MEFLKKILKKFIIQAKSSNLKLGKKVSLNLNSTFEGFNNIGDNCVIGDSYIGYGTYISSNSSLPYTKIGKYCAIGQNVQTCLGLHPSNTFVSIHPAFFSKSKQAGFSYTENQKFEEHKYIDSTKKFVTEIGNDVWIGNNVIIMDGITIEDGAIIAAGSVVTKNVLPYQIVGGIPAKPIKKRFSEEDIDFLLTIKWWDKPIEWIKKNSIEFINIENLKKSIKAENQ
jgi:acetyltransferase-like isoleucine patch superfamily enzyme